VSQPYFSAALNITNSVDTGNPNQFTIDCTVLDGTGLYSNFNIEVNNTIFLDTTGSGANPGGITRYLVVAINSVSIDSANLTIEFDDSESGGVEDPGNYIGQAAIIAQSSPNLGFSWLPDVGQQAGIPSYLVNFSRNDDSFTITDTLSVTGPTGAIGPTGQNGATGLTGINGATGPTGADSMVPGPTGSIGPTGATGSDADVLVDNVTIKINTDGNLEGLKPKTQQISLQSSDITNQYVDLMFPAYSQDSVRVYAGQIRQVNSTDFSVSLTGGVSGVTRVSFLNDLATGGSAALEPEDVLIVDYYYL
jgi:hypothetical protein